MCSLQGLQHALQYQDSVSRPNIQFTQCPVLMDLGIQISQKRRLWLQYPWGRAKRTWIPTVIWRILLKVKKKWKIIKYSCAQCFFLFIIEVLVMASSCQILYLCALGLSAGTLCYKVISREMHNGKFQCSFLATYSGFLRIKLS